MPEPESRLPGVWQKCPRCDGQGHTNRPPWIPGDQATWFSTTTVSYWCPPCGGTGLLWTGP
jgi:DnaJ-class molecular chaperone